MKRNASNEGYPRKMVFWSPGVQFLCFHGYGNLRGSEVPPKITEDCGYIIVAIGHNYQYSGSDEAFSGERQGRNMAYSKVL